jgi:hypothetical protein
MKSLAISDSSSRLSARRSRAVNGTLRTHKRTNLKAGDLFQLDKAVRGYLGGEPGPSVAFIYQDIATREWSREIYARISKLAGDQPVRTSWWKINDLSAPGILAGAVTSAVRADMIVIASRAEGLPLPFYVWVNLWWPHRSQMPGTLVALISAPTQVASGVGSVSEYLPIVAQQANMEFLRFEKQLPAHAKPERIPAFAIPNGHTLTGVNGIHRHD